MQFGPRGATLARLQALPFKPPPPSAPLLTSPLRLPSFRQRAAVLQQLNYLALSARHADEAAAEARAAAEASALAQAARAQRAGWGGASSGGGNGGGRPPDAPPPSLLWSFSEVGSALRA
eukprot:184176-Chlamydomonas_euryale.AAC.1